MKLPPPHNSENGARVFFYGIFPILVIIATLIIRYIFLTLARVS